MDIRRVKQNPCPYVSSCSASFNKKTLFPGVCGLYVEHVSFRCFQNIFRYTHFHSVSKMSAFKSPVILVFVLDGSGKVTYRIFKATNYSLLETD
jgi:hypothetical protein